MAERTQQVLFIAGAVIERSGEVLLVCQQGPDDPHPAWVLPGGIVDTKELLTEALSREIREETGLTVLDPGHIAWLAQVDAPRFGGQIIAITFAVSDWTGTIEWNDPDGFVIDAKFVSRALAIELLESIPFTPMGQPGSAFLHGQAGLGTIWMYRWHDDDEWPVLEGRVGGQLHLR